MWGVYDIDLWSESKAKDYIKDRLATLEVALDREQFFAAMKTDGQRQTVTQ